MRSACASLAEENTPVVLIMDSVSTLVHAANRPGVEGLAMSGFIRTVFDLNEVLICVPVASSATTVLTLQQCKFVHALYVVVIVCLEAECIIFVLVLFSLPTANPHVFFRTTPYHPAFVTDTGKLGHFLKQLLVHGGVSYTEADIHAAVGYFGGSLVTYITLVNRAQQTKSLANAFSLMIEDHRNNIKTILHFTADDTITAEERSLGLRCFEILKLAAKANKTLQEQAELRVYTNPAVQYLLRTRSPTLPLVGISPETSGLVLSWPGTANVIRDLQGRADELRQHVNKRDGSR